MDKEAEIWKSYALFLEKQVYILQANLRSPIARIHGIGEILRMEIIDSDEERLELIAAVSKEAEEAMGFLEKISNELVKKKREGNLD